MKQVLHVGMGKTATSSLQSHVFPELAKRGFVREYNPQDLHLELDRAVNGYVADTDVAVLASMQDDFFISNETLLEWDPALWEESADRLLRIFGQDVTILITIRDPKSYLRSLYQQTIHHRKIRPPQDFFLPAAEYKAIRRFIRPGELDAINVDAFDMSRMISLYTERFSSVIVVPFEAIPSLRFLTEIWDVPDTDRKALCQAFADSPRVNTSYSQLAVRMTLAAERFLAHLGLRWLSASDRQLIKARAHARNIPYTKPKFGLPSWNRVMRLVSRFGPKASYRLPQDQYLGRHLAKNTVFYDALRVTPNGFVHFKDGIAQGIDLKGDIAMQSPEPETNG